MFLFKNTEDNQILFLLIYVYYIYKSMMDRKNQGFNGLFMKNGD